MTGKEQLRLPEHLRYVSTSDGAVVLNIRNGIMFSMNPVASNIFEAVMEGRTEDQIVADISGRFEVESSRVLADLAVLMQDLDSKDLLPRKRVTGV